MQSARVWRFVFVRSIIHQIPVQSNANCNMKSADQQLSGSTGITVAITNSDLNRPCFAWHPYGKSGLFKTELVIGG